MHFKSVNYRWFFKYLTLNLCHKTEYGIWPNLHIVSTLWTILVVKVFTFSRSQLFKWRATTFGKVIYISKHSYLFCNQSWLWKQQSFLILLFLFFNPIYFLVRVQWAIRNRVQWFFLNYAEPRNQLILFCIKQTMPPSHNIGISSQGKLAERAATSAESKRTNNEELIANILKNYYNSFFIVLCLDSTSILWQSDDNGRSS